MQAGMKKSYNLFERRRLKKSKLCPTFGYRFGFCVMRNKGRNSKAMNKTFKTISFLLLFFLWHAASVAQEQKTIVFFGNSLTAGLGVEPDQSFPGIIRQKLQENNLNYKGVNAGLSGETTAGGLGRVDWVLKNNKVDLFVLELGANDGLRGLDIEQTKRNLAAIIAKVRAKEPDAVIVLAGMQMPPNLGPGYTARFKNIFPELAREHDVELIPFLLEGVGGNPKMNQSDGIHPNVEGHKKVAENVWEVLRPLL